MKRIVGTAHDPACCPSGNHILQEILKPRHFLSIQKEVRDANIYPRSHTCYPCCVLHVPVRHRHQHGQTWLLQSGRHHGGGWFHHGRYRHVHYGQKPCRFLSGIPRHHNFCRTGFYRHLAVLLHQSPLSAQVLRKSHSNSPAIAGRGCLLPPRSRAQKRSHTSCAVVFHCLWLPVSGGGNPGFRVVSSRHAGVPGGRNTQATKNRPDQRIKAGFLRGGRAAQGAA